jgi:type II secretory pathway component PulK
MKAFEIKSTDKEILIRLDKTELSTSDLINIVNRLRLEVLAQKSSLTPDQAQRLADEVDNAWWEQHGESFLKDVKP